MTSGAAVSTSEPEPAEPEPPQTKAELRQSIRRRRLDRPLDERERLARRLAMVALESPVIRRASCVAVYASRIEEPGTGPLRVALRARRIRVLLPVIREDHMLGWADDCGDESLRPGERGMPEPAGPAAGPQELAAAAVILVPALAVDGSGTRLGKGGGYYDRALLHAMPLSPVLAVLFDDELLDAADGPIPRQPHDRAVHGVITPSKWIFFN